ncbi:YeiH family protein [Nocardioides sp. DS6]|uniref:YeiH family protein n=1 Tax=Nocardioides eburneus TaxID=3231482 RepID=A0ABV3SV81_9ACTN
MSKSTSPALASAFPPPRVLPHVLRGTPLGRLLPGLAAAVALAVVSTAIGRAVPVLGSAVPAVVLGAAIATVRRPGPRLVPGLQYAGSRVLQVAVAVLGLRLSLGQVVEVGAASLPVMLGTLAVCLVVAQVAGRGLGVTGDLRILIGSGTGICGASAIAAVSPVIGAVGADVAYAISTIFVFNIAAVVVFPLVGHALGLSQHAFGLFAGTAVNDTSSVVAAASAYGSVAADHAVVVKLVRTVMIVPVVLVLAVVTRRRRTAPGTAPERLTPLGVVRLVPWFLLAFLLMAAIDSLGLVPAHADPGIAAVSTFLITVALAGIGLSTDLPALRRTGPRPLVLGAVLWVTVSVVSLGIQAFTTGW